jgi:predicted PurR-regulated permease PerM
MLEHIDSDVQKYLAIKTLISLMVGVLTTVVLFIFGVDFAIVFGFLAFLLNYIPNVGSIIAVGLPVVIALLQFGKFWPVLWIFIIITVLDNIIGNILEPKLMGKGLGLSPLAVLFSLFFWLWLWGIPGMILAVPILAIFKIVASNIPSLKIAEELMSK